MQRRRTVGVLCFGIGLGLAACSDGPGEPSEDPCDAAREIRSSQSFLGVAEEADVVARVIPGGFGSLFFDFTSGTLVVFLKDVAKAAAAKTALQKVLSCNAAYPGWLGELIRDDVYRFLPGLYSGTELLAFRQLLQPIRNDPDVWAMEVDPETNKIWVGLRTASAQARIQQAVAGASVPLSAVAIETPPVTNGSEPFLVLDSPVTTQGTSLPGVLEFVFHLQYTNRFQETRYPDRCPEPLSAYSFFLYRLQKWDGTNWTYVYDPLCDLVALVPRPVAAGQSLTDSVPGAAVRRLQAIPVWQTARITGTYRVVGSVFLSTTPNPPFLTNPAPFEEGISAPFRVIHPLPF
jgi:hypothetical protein